MKTFQKGVFVEGAQKASMTEKGDVIARKGKLEPKYVITANNPETEYKSLIGKVEVGDIILDKNYNGMLLIVSEVNILNYVANVISGSYDVSLGNDIYIGYIIVNIDSVIYTVDSFQLVGDDDSILVYNEAASAFELRKVEFGTKLYKHTLYIYCDDTGFDRDVYIICTEPKPFTKNPKHSIRIIAGVNLISGSLEGDSQRLIVGFYIDTNGSLLIQYTNENSNTYSGIIDTITDTVTPL